MAVMAAVVEIDGHPARWTDTDGYAVTDDGRVWSFRVLRGPNHGNEWVVDQSRSPRQLAPAKRGRYLTVTLSGCPGRRRKQYVHRVVWQAWHGDIPSELQVRHLDGDARNNALSNLALGTQVENEADKLLHGTRLTGSAHPNSLLTPSLVAEARRRFRSGQTLDDICRELNLGVNRATLHDAATGSTWSVVDHEEPPVPKAGRWPDRSRPREEAVRSVG